jgi:hypothetical protein
MDMSFEGEVVGSGRDVHAAFEGEVVDPVFESPQTEDYAQAFGDEDMGSPQRSPLTPEPRSF